LDRSKLAEVVIESKRHVNAELFHHNFARAIGEAPTLVIELLKCFPRKHQISGCDLVYFRKIMMKEPGPKSSARFLSPRALSSVSVSSIT
jgi:hypothetical protein